MLISDAFPSYLLSYLQARERRERKKAEQKELREWERNKETSNAETGPVMYGGASAFLSFS